MNVANVQARATARGVIDLREAAEILGIGRTLAYRLVREGRWPTPVIRIGRLIRVPVEPLNEYLHDPSATVARPPPSPPRAQRRGKPKM